MYIMIISFFCVMIIFHLCVLIRLKFESSWKWKRWRVSKWRDGYGRVVNDRSTWQKRLQNSFKSVDENDESSSKITHASANSL